MSWELKEINTILIANKTQVDSFRNRYIDQIGNFTSLPQNHVPPP